MDAILAARVLTEVGKAFHEAASGTRLHNTDSTDVRYQNQQQAPQIRAPGARLSDLARRAAAAGVPPHDRPRTRSAHDRAQPDTVGSTPPARRQFDRRVSRTRLVASASDIED